MRVLVTGGAGYIGSHACRALLDAGHHVVALDNLVRGHRAPIQKLAEQFQGRISLIEADAGDTAAVYEAMRAHQIDTVLHFAALAYVGESVDDPMRYYRLNVASMIGLLEACQTQAISRIVFSSSCATYGDPPAGLIPVPENCPQNPTSPYGRTKLMGEQMLLDFVHASKLAGRPVSVAMLRYFNVAGSDPTGLLGEDHKPETHLIPIAVDAALGRRDGMAIFGTDYPTPDGTNIRDYVHVQDLIDSHLRALDSLDPTANTCEAYNVGIGQGYSVREILEAVKRVSGTDFPVREEARRAGDAIQLFNDPTKIRRELGWEAKITDLDEIVRTCYEWRRDNPEGYGD
ncbi:MAG: UDP-glucose 4-epimerase [Phycisphaerales bacterium]|jgi:UDP-glucose 4-epimerase